jgi:hypothetical protein
MNYKDFPSIEQDSQVLKLTFTCPSSFFYLMFGIPFITFSGCGLVFFVGVGIVLAFGFAKAGMLREVMTFFTAMITPILFISLFIGVGIWLVRQGTKAVIVEAVIWIFDKTQRQFSVSQQYCDRRTSQRWLQVVQTYPLPLSNAVSQQSGYDEPNYIVIRMGNEKIKSPGHNFGFRKTIQQITQFLDS